MDAAQRIVVNLQYPADGTQAAAGDQAAGQGHDRVGEQQPTGAAQHSALI